MAQMSLHRVLSELKMLDKRINGGISKLNVIGIKKGDKFLNPMSEETFSNEAKSDLESLETLIKRRYELKRALILANAENKVIINGMYITIAEAIDYKSIIEYKKKEYNRLHNLYTEAISKYEQEYKKNEVGLEKFILSLTGKDSSKISSDELSSLTATYNKSNEIKIVDPLSLKNKLDKLKEEIDEFENEIDSVLSEANAKFHVEI